MKFLLLSLSLTTATFCFGQDSLATRPAYPKEIRLNVLQLLLGLTEVSFEHYLAENTSVGVSAAYSFDDLNEYDYLIFPHFRAYLGKKPNLDYIIDLNLGFFSQRSYNVIKIERESHLGLGVGFAFGGKFIGAGKITGEVLLGAGINFINVEQNSGFYPRIGLSFGKQF